MIRLLFGLMATVLISTHSFAQEQPKLVVGIVVDQMKQEYLWRFYNDLGEDGFKRLVEGGFMAKNGHYNYASTSTGPGHASIYTGTTPSVHGIVNNSWYNRFIKEWLYCAGDSTVQAVGGSARAGRISPANLYSSTITDELKLFTQRQGKVIAMSIKDRGSALPGGHYSDGSYWYDSRTGNFMTSTYYKSELPSWVKSFNAQKLPQRYLSQTWELSKDINQYTASGEDNSPYERGFAGKETPTFPYDLGELALKNGALGMLPSTPYGNTILTDLALEAIDQEGLGQDEIPDFLAISYSSTDYIGHNFGPLSKEVHDTYIKLDQELARLLNKLDETVGEGNYVVFLSADHAVAENSKRMNDDGFRTNNIDFRAFGEYINTVVKEKYGNAEWFEISSGLDLFLNREVLAKKKVDLYQMQLFVSQKAMEFEGIYLAIPGIDMIRNSYNDQLRGLMQSAYHPKQSGDIKMILDPGWQSGGPKGTGHGNAWNYDTHIPVIFYGWGINQGATSVREIHITDIAPTVSMLLNMRMTSGNTGTPIFEALKN